MCLLIAAATAGEAAAQLLIAPVILRKVETAAPLSQLLATIGGFALALIVLSGLVTYLKEGAIYSRVTVRTQIVAMIGEKMSSTSYPNLLDTRFLERKAKADGITGSNDGASEHLWTTWTELLLNLLGFGIYLVLLSDLPPALLLVVVTAGAGFLVSKRVNELWYRYDEQLDKHYAKAVYLRTTAAQRTHAKDIRIFGLKDWLDDLWLSFLQLYLPLHSKQQRLCLWTYGANVLLTLLRNGIAYAYLIRLTLAGGLSAAQFLLYFTAFSGFSQWGTGILSQCITLVKLVCGLLDPTQGRVLLNGQDIRRYNRRDYYALFSAVFQDFSLLEASIAENVAQQVTDIDTQRVWHCLELAGVAESIRGLPQGLDTKLGRQVFEAGVELSGGQLQRLMLARALYKDGAFLILDEPTAALDPLAEAALYANLNHIVEDRTAVYISHRLSSCKFCDEILVFQDGSVVQQGSHQALLTQTDGVYAQLWNAQAQYYQTPPENQSKET